MTGILRIGLLSLGLLFAAAIGLPSSGPNSYLGQVAGTVEAVAQQAKKKKRRSLFSILFGRKTAKKKAVKKRSRRRTKKASKRKRKAKGRKTASRKKRRNSKRRVVATAPTKIEKLADAKVVLVVGDFFAGGLADGLEKALSQVANVRVVDKSNGLSGLVRADVVDWPAALAPLVEEHKPAYVVAMVGSNDRQLIRENGKKLKKRTPEWDVSYTKRVVRMGEALKASRLPFSWVGLPPVRFKKMSKDFLFFNELYGKSAASEFGKFVDIWDGYSDADGNYSRSGPDVKGQIVMLRPKDGINLTKAGKSRLAFYVQNEVIKVLGGSSSRADIAGAFDPEIFAPKAAAYDPADTGKTIVVSLDDPSADGGEALAGEVIDLGNAVAPPRVVPVLNGPQPSGRQEGRVDDYLWPPAGGSTIAGTPSVASRN